MNEPDWQEQLSVQAFLTEEAQRLDESRWLDWQALLTDDFHYWVTTSPKQTDPVGAPSLAYEDRLLIQLRIDRLNHPQAHSQKPPSKSQHVMQAPRIIDRRTESGDSAESEPSNRLVVVARSAFHYTEKRGPQQIHLTGTVHHTLVADAPGWRIRLKRIDLLGADAPLPMVQLFL